MTGSERFNYRNSIQGLYRMTREEGLGAWARGIAPNTVRSILMNMSQLARSVHPRRVCWLIALAIPFALDTLRE